MASSRPLSAQDILNNSDRGLLYPNPFFDLANNYIPRNLKTLFNHCRTFYYTNGFLRNVINKLTQYPITDILYAPETPTAVRKKYNKILNKKLNIKSFIEEIGLDYHVYGNCFISSFIKPKRFLKFPGDDNLYPIEKVEYRLRNFKILARHPKTGNEQEVEIHDEYVKSIDNFRLVRWAPQNIEIKRNPITGTTVYYYKIPNRIKKKIITGDKTTINEIPKVFLDSLREKKAIKIDQNNFFHLKRPTLAEENSEWGKPLILPALKDIYYMQTLKRGNEAIAHEHITPKKAISPSANTSLDPFSQLNLGKWTSKMKDQIKKWRTDPNHIGVFPIPITYQELGGNARALLLTNEMQLLEENIINSLGVPIEFIKGGASWTGSSISLRIVENGFLRYRELLEKFLNHFLVDKLVNSLGYPEVTLRFKKFKMSDDAQAKQLILNLSAQDKISDERLLDEFGYNYEEEIEAIKRDQDEKLEMQINAQKRQAEAQGEAQIILKKYEIRANYQAQLEQISMQLELFQDEIEEEHGELPMDPLKMVEHYALKILYTKPDVQEAELSKMEKEMPITHSLVVARIQQLMESSAAQQAEQTDGKVKKQEAPNQQPPGTREKDKIVVPETQKTRANSRGEPRT